MSTPHVTGTIALLYSLECDKLISASKNEPAETALRVKNMILNGVDRNASLESQLLSGGRLNAARAMNQVDMFCTALIGDFGISSLSPNPTNDRLNISYSVPEITPLQIRILNVFGEFVYDEEFMPNPDDEGQLNMNVNFLGSGTYFIQLLQENRIVGATFVKI